MVSSGKLVFRWREVESLFLAGEKWKPYFYLARSGNLIFRWQEVETLFVAGEKWKPYF